jgi:hypothetical protein
MAKLTDLGLTRGLIKEAVQDIETKDSTFVSVNNSEMPAGYVATGSTAIDVNQGTVIIRADRVEAQSIDLTKGFVNTQLTSIALPTNGVRVDFNGIYGTKAGVTTFSIDTNGNAFFGGTLMTAASGARVLIDDSNNISLFDASVGGGGTVTGNSSEIRLVKATQNTKYFVIQRRAGKDSNDDGVLEIFPTAPVSGGHNFIFIGRDGVANTLKTAVVSVDANIVSSESYSTSNGLVQMRVTTDSSDSSQANLVISDSRQFGSSYGGVSVVMNGTGSNMAVGLFDTGVSKFYYSKGLGQPTGLYADVQMNVGNVVPQNNNNYNLGSTTKAFIDLFLNSVGQVFSDGSVGTPFPSGWSVTKPGTGYYRVNHFMGTQNYTVVANAYSTTAKFCNIYVISADYFEVRIVNFAGSAEDNNFGFILVRNPNG